MRKCFSTIAVSDLSFECLKRLETNRKHFFNFLKKVRKLLVMHASSVAPEEEILKAEVLLDNSELRLADDSKRNDLHDFMPQATCIAEIIGVKYHITVTTS